MSMEDENIERIIKKVANIVKKQNVLKTENAKFKALQMSYDNDYDKLKSDLREMNSSNAELREKLQETKAKLEQLEYQMMDIKQDNLKLEQAAKNLVSENLRLKERLRSFLPKDDD